jgi:hypothetical protein
MLRDTLAALDRLPKACARFRTNLPRRAQAILAQLEITIRGSLHPAEAYSMVPGHSPETVKHPSIGQASRHERWSRDNVERDGRGLTWRSQYCWEAAEIENS